MFAADPAMLKTIFAFCFFFFFLVLLSFIRTRGTRKRQLKKQTAQLSKFYLLHNPAKAQDAAYLLAHFTAANIGSRLMAKYGAVPEGPGWTEDCPDVATTGAGTGAGAGAGADGATAGREVAPLAVHERATASGSPPSTAVADGLGSAAGTATGGVARPSAGAQRRLEALLHLADETAVDTDGRRVWTDAPIVQLHADANATADSTGNSVRLWSAQSPSAPSRFRVEVSGISATVGSCAALLADVARRPEWDHVIARIERVVGVCGVGHGGDEDEDEDAGCETVLTQCLTRAQWPTSARSLLLHTRWHALPGGALALVMRTVSLGGNGTLKGGGGAIDTTGTVEARVALQGFVLRPMPSASGGDGRSTGCCLTVLNDVDAGGYVPKWLLKQVNQDEIPKSFQRFARLAQSLPPVSISQFMANAAAAGSPVFAAAASADIALPAADATAGKQNCDTSGEQAAVAVAHGGTDIGLRLRVQKLELALQAQARKLRPGSTASASRQRDSGTGGGDWGDWLDSPEVKVGLAVLTVCNTLLLLRRR